MQAVLDIEGNNLLGPALDYTKLPYKLKPTYRVWCVVIRKLSRGLVISLDPETLSREALKKALEDVTELIGHNIVAFDLPVLALYGLIEYRIGYPGEPSTVFGRVVIITDTLIWSKLLNADRLGGHSLAAWGKRLGNFKGDFEDWEKFSQEMLDYCIQDTGVNVDIYLALMQEKYNEDFDRAYPMEVKLADLTMRQEYFGFQLNQELAHKNLEELQEKMDVVAEKVNPILPLKKLTKTAIKVFTPPATQFKKDGTINAHMTKFMEKHGITYVAWMNEATLDGKTYTLPMTEPIKTHEVATVEDIDVVKGYLLGMGWVPSEVKERDLIKKTDKTTKTYKEIIETIDRYVEQTGESLFKELRCEILEVEFEGLRDFLLDKVEKNRDGKYKPIWVPSTPKLTVGVEKEICRNLLELGEKAEFVQSVAHYYTYRHRRNSIAGGVLDDEGEPETGFLSALREDGRVPTPADTLGANTGRYRHKVVCNIPRVTSLFGEQMRNMFEAGQGLWQLGYDFASLEARVMGHYVMKYKNGPDLALALIAAKPNDIHSINARKLGIERDAAKSFSYAAIYGAQPKKLAKMLGISVPEAKKLFNEYWDAVPALKELKEKVESAWERNGKKFIRGLDGRRLSTRSKHSLINVLFQSGGAICAKWSAVFLAQEMEKRGILGDPFRDEIGDAKVWWMIHMHDEQQQAVHPSLMKIEVFETEDEAKAYKKEHAPSAGIGHGKKGWYVTMPTEPIECIEIGINKAVEYLNLEVELGFEYIAGRNWGQCH